MPKKIDLTGQKFARLEVISESPERGNQKQILWECICDCGNSLRVAAYSLRSGNTKSCGCLQRELTVERSKSHGLTDTRIYRIWAGILSRCDNPNARMYPNYGARGIRVSEDWHTFENFFSDMGADYSDDLTLERKDVNGDYCVENCEWVSMKEQARNKRRYRNNKTGHTGVYEYVLAKSIALVAVIQNPSTGKPSRKRINLNSMSREAAMAILLDWLKEKRVEYGYKHTHGSHD